MSNFERITGTAYTSDRDYAAFSGRLVRTSSTVHYDPKLKAWIKRTVEWIDVGRSAPVPSVDPDSELNQQEEDTKLFNDPNEPLAKAWQVTRDNKIQRDAELLGEIRKAFQKHGPMTIPKIAKFLKPGVFVVREVIRANPDVFCFFGGASRVWGLHGQTYEPKKIKKITPLMKMMRDLLLERGPLSAGDIAGSLGKYQATVLHSLTTRSEWFTVISVRPVMGNVPPTRLWGIVGIHD
jgi:hypothetical protein